MGLFDRRREHRASLHRVADLDVDGLVASARLVRSTDNEQSVRKRLPPWQRQALEFYDILGECWYPAQFYGRMLSRVRLYPALRRGDGTVEEIDDPQAQEVLNRIQDPGGGTSQWKEAYGRLQFLIGDGYLTATIIDDQEAWEYLSPAELIPSGDGKFKRIIMPGAPGMELEEASATEELADGEIRAWRLWRRHPTHSGLSDAPTRSVLSQYEYLMLVDKAARAQALSRIVGSGLLVVAEEITIPGADSEDADEDPESDPFVKALTDHIITPISQPGSASAVAPLVMRVQMGEKRADDLIKLIQLHDPSQTGDWHTRIEKTITRIAIGLDMPPEEFLGLSGANHWTGWVITDEKWKAHGEPVTIRLCDDLTAAYFRPACIAENVPRAEELIIWFDAAQVVTHPDRGKDANETHDRGALSDSALRRAHNFSDHDAPSPEERAFFEDVKLKISARPKDPSEVDAEGTGDGIQGDAPTSNGSKSRTSSPSPMNDGQARVRGAAELAFQRCRAMAGTKVLSKRMSCPECFRGSEEIPKSELIAHLGPDVLPMLEITDTAALVKGGTDEFWGVIQTWGVWKGTASIMSDLIERHAAETIFDRKATLPESFMEELTNV